jgi:hypothetical protein
MVGSIAMNSIPHDALFPEAELLVDVAGTVIGYKNVQNEPVCAVLAKYEVCHFDQNLFPQALIGSPDYQTLEFHRSVFRTEPLEDCEGGNPSFLIFCHDVDHIRIAQHSLVLFFRP